MADLSLLMDMGFSESDAEKALSMTGNNGVEAAMEWILAQQETAETSKASEGEKKVSDDTDKGAENPDVIENIQDLGDSMNIEAKCIKCDECSKKFQNDSEIEFHAVKTGHSSFSESTEEMKLLSDEEKKEQMRKLEVIIKQRRAEKIEQEKKEALEREKSRRKTGQELTNARQKLQEEEIKHMVEMKKREKMEDKMARQRILDEIERDKKARLEKFGGAQNIAPVAAPAPVQTSTITQIFDECRLQIRLTNGQCITQKFNPKEQLAAVRLYVEMNRTDGAGPFSLMTNFPKKVFNEDDMDASLTTLGLVPSAVLIVSKPQQQ